MSHYRSMNLTRYGCTRFQIKSATLRYIASDRIQRLANAKPLNEETILNLKYDPNTKILNAIKYKGNWNFIYLSIVLL